ncbi:Mastermind-like protein 3 like protein [Argiope bruennichi]|uniref:Mastermind-like protein 3 like protein n=1 Tax=Argiope bruennichi TaxID=94029 RepID=A0A8T0F3F7_ARGBR|nr:Mastermind-like protein 3 like protein [Argiope bruennichi]
MGSIPLRHFGDVETSTEASLSQPANGASIPLRQPANGASIPLRHFGDVETTTAASLPHSVESEPVEGEPAYLHNKDELPRVAIFMNLLWKGFLWFVNRFLSLHSFESEPSESGRLSHTSSTETGDNAMISPQERSINRQSHVYESSLERISLHSSESGDNGRLSRTSSTETGDNAMISAEQRNRESHIYESSLERISLHSIDSEPEENNRLSPASEDLSPILLYGEFFREEVDSPSHSVDTEPRPETPRRFIDMRICNKDHYYEATLERISLQYNSNKTDGHFGHSTTSAVAYSHQKMANEEEACCQVGDMFLPDQSKIARHEIPDWCEHPQRGSPADIAILYQHCSPNGEATTLDVACYPPQGGPVTGGPDILPPKRQTVVDRLKRRLEHYRRHQGSCEPRYDQSANGQYDIQRQETLHLKQRYLEAKAKKTRRNDHGRNSAASANNNDSSQRNSNANPSRLKRQVNSPSDSSTSNAAESHANKISRPEQPCDSFPSTSQQQTQQQSQQFQPSSAVSMNGTQNYKNLTVNGMNAVLIKSSNSPLAVTAASSASPGCVTPVGTADGGQLSSSVQNTAETSTAASVPSSELKSETDPEFPTSNVNGPLPLSELNSELTSANNNVNTNTTPSAATTDDRFSDSLANLGFPDVPNGSDIHSTFLNDFMDDVFTNQSDLMNGFNFVDNLNLKDTLDGDQDSSRSIMSLNKSMLENPSNHFQNPTNSPNLFNMNQSQQTVFDFPTTAGINSSTNSPKMPTSNNVQENFISSLVGTYTASSPNMSVIPNNGLGLDFKLTEPSPAAQTLKQMAEQHQSMQSKQQQLGLGVSPRSPFGSDSFPDPLSNIRTNFLNNSPNSMPTLQKSPPGMYQSMSFQQQSFTASNNSAVKQEVVAPNTPMYTSNLNQHLSDLELHKRRQQALQIQHSQMGNLTRPPFSHSPDQKRQFPAMRQLPTYNDPSPGHPSHDGNTNNSSAPHHTSQFLRNVSTPEITPSSQIFSSSSVSSAGAMHHLQHNANQQQQMQTSYPSNVSSMNSLPVSSTNIATAKTYQRRMGNSNLPASQPYAVPSGVLQGQSQMIPVSTAAPTFKGRSVGKQVAARRGRQSGPLYRQQKPPNGERRPRRVSKSQASHQS